jgi:hypothetical protein
LEEVAAEANPKPETHLFADDDGTADEDLKFYLSGLFDIETSPAFRQIDLLKSKKDIPADQIEALGTTIKALYANILSTAEFEKNMGKRVKQLFQDVANQRMERDKTVSKQFAQNAEIGELKRELLKVFSLN